MKSEIQKVFTVTPFPDDPPKGEIRTVASIGGEEAIHQKGYEFIMNVCFEVREENLDSRQVNPLLRKFREQLENYKFKEGEIKIWIGRVTEFESELINTNWLVCSQQILWRGYSPRGFSCEGIKPRLLRDMLTQELKDEETSITIRMTNALYEGSQKQGRWPRDRFDGAGF